ncbi:MAG TPA: TlpA disulfide reductase family protein [Rhodanobacteraceae bacterium]|nr:TlpA disulfide reductase family protein [Rhodanobacteraceae bacterium]
MRKDTDAKTADVQLKPADDKPPKVSLAAMQKMLADYATLSIKVGAAVPDISGSGLDGKKVTHKAASGKYSLLSFYFSECAPCIAEVPDLNAFAARHPDVNLLAVTFDSTEEARAFKAKHHFEVTTVADAHGYISTLGVKAYPTLVIIDPAGKLVASKSGGVISTVAPDGLKNLERWFEASTHHG